MSAYTEFISKLCELAIKLKRVSLNVYTHIVFDDAEEELKRMEDLQNARKELEQTRGRSWCRKGCLRQYDYRKNERCFAVAGRFLYRESCINMVQ